MTETVPWVKWNFDKWRGDEGLRMCSLAARGLWIDLLSVMHGCDPYGHLAIKGRAPSNRQIASLVGMTSEKEVGELLLELEDNGVLSRTDDGIIYSRRLVRDNASRQKGKAYGSMGGNPMLVGAKGKPLNQAIANDVNDQDNGKVNHDNRDDIALGLTPPVIPEKEKEEEKEEEVHSLRSCLEKTPPETEDRLRPGQALAEAMRIWNEVCGARLAKVTKATDTRRDIFKRRFRDDFGEDWEAWRRYCQRISVSPFLTNETGQNKFGWKADFDFVLEPKNLAKITEGTWDRRVAEPTQRPFAWGSYG